MATSLVTGGAGFIGSQLIRTLLAAGHEVRVLDNFSTGKERNLAHVRSNIDLVEGDIRDVQAVQSAVKGMDYVFHQAAFVSVPLSMDRPERCFETNVSGTNILLRAAADAGVQRVVLASSSAVYGNSEDIPLAEDGEVMALSPYAASKRANEIYADLYTRAFDLEAVCLRYFNVYGPRQSPDSDYAAVIPIFSKRLSDEKRPVIFGDGSQTRDFVYVEDVARANLLAASAPGAPGMTFNICTGEEVSIQTLFERIRGLVASQRDAIYGEERPGDIYRSVGDPRRAEKVLGFEPRVPLREGLERTLEWMANWPTEEEER